MNVKECYNRLLARKLVEELAKRNLEGYYCENKEQALAQALKIIPEDSFVACGGSVTLDEIGLRTALKHGRYNFLDPKDAQGVSAMQEAARAALSADYFLMSVNAITETGELVSADGIGNRVAALIFGPKHVIVIAGLNKVEPNLEAAVLRVKNRAAQMGCMAYKQDYPSFDDLAKAAADSCSQLVIISKSVFKGRIKVILVGEDLGW